MKPVRLISFILSIFITSSHAVEQPEGASIAPFPLFKLPQDITNVIITLADVDSEIQERCQLEQVSKTFTTLLPDRDKWKLVQYWEVMPVKGISWRDRWEGFFCFKNYQICEIEHLKLCFSHFSFLKIFFGDDQSEDEREEEEKNKKREKETELECIKWINKSYHLKDPWAIYEMMIILQTGKMKSIPIDLTAADAIMQSKNHGAVMEQTFWLNYHLLGEYEDYKQLVNIPGKLKEYVEEKIKNNDILFKHMKFICYLTGDWEYPHDLDAARRFLMQVPGDNNPEPINRKDLIIIKGSDFYNQEQNIDCTVL